MRALKPTTTSALGHVTSQFYHNTIEETDKDIKDSPVAGRTRKATNKAELPKKVFQKAMKAAKAPIKFINVIIPPRNPNIVYKELYEEDPPLPKAMIAKLVTHNEDKPSYETAMAGPETPQ